VSIIPNDEYLTKTGTATREAPQSSRGHLV